MSSRGTCGSQDALKIHAGDHILETRVLVSIELRRIEGLKARREDDRTYVQVNGGFLLIKIDCVVFTELLAGLTLALLASVDGLKVETSASVYGVLERYRLSKRDINSLALIHPQVKLIRHFLRTLRGTNTTTDALVFIDIAGVLDNSDLEVSFLTADAVYIGKGDEADVGVPADLDQLGGDDSHGTLIGRKGFVQLCHDSTDSRGPLHQVDIKSRVG